MDCYEHFGVWREIYTPSCTFTRIIKKKQNKKEINDIKKNRLIRKKKKKVQILKTTLVLNKMYIANILVRVECHASCIFERFKIQWKTYI
jgi:hypothetical protein